MEEFEGKDMRYLVRTMSKEVREALNRLEKKIVPASISEYDVRTMLDFMMVKAVMDKSLELMDAVVNHERPASHDEPTEEDYRKFEEFLKNLDKEEE